MNYNFDLFIQALKNLYCTMYQTDLFIYLFLKDTQTQYIKLHYTFVNRDFVYTIRIYNPVACSIVCILYIRI